ncbi:MAG: RNA ligase [Thermodesulfovibrionales bacterium]|nr:RNA ligase [Thermodesulfovibrionales bacterium]
MEREILKDYFTDGDIENLLRKKILEPCHAEGLEYFRLSQEFKKYYRGTVFHEKGFIPGYPRIPRILHLENGIKRYFKNSFYIEEKMDGYNVRLCLINSRPLAFTRGGFVCPFTTDRIDDFVNPDFFRKYPDYIICGEVVGPGNPYNIETTSYIKEDVAFFVFDLFNEKGERLPPEKRYAIVKEFNMKEVRRWGPFSATEIEKIKEIVLELNYSMREGIVIKSIDGKVNLKYVTLSSCLRDLEATTHLITELPAGFYIQRILRAIFFSNEFKIPLTEEYLLESAKAFYLKPLETLRSVEKGKGIREVFSVKVKNKTTINKLIKHLSRAGIRTELLEIKEEQGYFNFKFARLYTKGTKEFRQRLMGKSFYD